MPNCTRDVTDTQPLTVNKVTTDPETYNDPQNENPGMVTSDSLAAESIQAGGSFAANSDARGPMDQPSYSTTTNTADVSNATRLDPAVDAEARQASEEWNENAQLNAGIGLGKDAGRGPTWNIPSNSTNQGGDDARGGDWPKGKDLNEGGFDSDAPNASYSTEIGTKKDPGREALKRFEEENAPYAGGAGPREETLTRDGQYDALKRDASA